MGQESDHPGPRALAGRQPLETSLPGVFAAGDVRRGSVKRVASAVGEGAATIPLVHRHLARAAAAGKPSSASLPAGDPRQHTTETQSAA
jgi:NADPH-dependent glutamate synthase beta subunit-like oxidoreductase